MLFSPTFLLFSSIFFTPSLSDAEVSENILEGFLRGYALFARDFCKVVDDHAEVFGEEVAAETEVHRSNYTLERLVCVEQG